MTTIRNFCCNDFLRFSSVNLDHFTITGSMVTYFTWLAQWPDYFIVALSPRNRIMGYFLAGIQDYYREGHLVLPRVQDQPGVEDLGKQWYGHIITVSVHPEYRRRGLGMKFMRLFENELLYKMDFSPRIPPYALRLFVGFSNTPAIKFFNKFGFRQYRGIEKFYIEEEEAIDMRKSLVEEEEGFRELELYDLPVSHCGNGVCTTSIFCGNGVSET